LLAAAVLAPIATLSAQREGGPGGANRDTTKGFVIRDQAIIANCSGCHVRDSSGYLKRISYLRKTPEGWETSIRRMVTLNGVKLDPGTARAIVKYLSNQQGIAPSELRPGRFESERRSIEYRYAADTRTENTCKACHSLGRVITQRRTREEWELLVATHRGYYPDADFQGFRRFAPQNPDSAPQPHPMDQAIQHLARAFPLRTADWAAWSATMRPPPLEGTWVLSGYEAGRGPFYGKVTIAKVTDTDDEFTSHATYRYARETAPVTRDGRSIVFTGYQWRGRSAEAGPNAGDAWREVMMVEPGWQEVSGRWFKGGYDEMGMDVTLTRLGSNMVLAGVVPKALKTGDADQEITIFGANLPAGIQRSSIDFGPGVHVQSVKRSSADEVTLLVHVDSAASIGARDLFVAGSALKGAVSVYDKIARIKVTPVAGMARVGGLNFPKQFAQFEAIAYHNGVDGKPDTEDDIELGPVDATWSLSEYGATFDDDDVKFVGAIDQRGKFTPAPDGPNPQRSGSRNNIGDVWAVATYKTPGKDARTLTARAHLLVTVPLYIRWEPWRAEP
jgi:quinohemoprotein amine dehydrogenase